MVSLIKEFLNRHGLKVAKGGWETFIHLMNAYQNQKQIALKNTSGIKFIKTHQVKRHAIVGQKKVLMM